MIWCCTKKKVWIIQAGGHAKQCIDIFMENGFQIIGAFDNFITKDSEFYRGVKIIDTIEKAKLYIKDEDNVFCTIGDNQKRYETIRSFSNLDFNWINCISKNAFVSPTAILGKGIYIGNHTKVLSDSSIGDFTILNDGSTVTHDNKIGSFTHIAPNASLGGRVCIGDFCLIGTNSSVNPNISIWNNIIIGSGGLVCKDIKVEGKYVGLPVENIHI